MTAKTRRAWIAAAVAGTAFASVAAEAAVLVVRSSGPSAKTYPAGRSLPDGAPVALKQGDVLTVLVANATRTLRGPGTFTLGAPVRVAANFNTRGRFGAMRTGEIPAPPTIWDVDVSQSGTVCVADPAKLRLWRPESNDKVTLSIGTPAGAEQTLEWAAGEETLAWPAAVPLAEGEYRISWTGNSDPSRLSFAKLPAAPADPLSTASALIEKGCQGQLELFIETTPSEAE